MSSTDFKNMMNKIMREESDRSSSNNIFRSTFRSTFRSGTFLESKKVRHWKVDLDPKTRTRFAITEIIDSDQT